MRMSSIMRWRSGLMPWLVWVMTLLPLTDEADCLALQHENRVGFPSITAIAGRSPLPRERFRSSSHAGPSRQRLVSAEEIPHEKKAADIAAARNTHVAQGALTQVPSYTSAFLKQSGISSEYMREAALSRLPWGGLLSIAAADVAEWPQGPSAGIRIAVSGLLFDRACAGIS